MKTKMRDTSLAAYNTLDLNAQEQLVLDALLELSGIASNREVARLKGMDCSTVAGRMNSLVKKKLVFEGYKTKDLVTGRPVIKWAVNNKQLKLL